MRNKNLAVLRFEIPYERDAFRFNLLGTFREMTVKQVRNSSLSFLVNLSYMGMTRLLFNFGEARMIFLLSALNTILLVRVVR